MSSDLPSIVRLAEQLQREIEIAVRRFPRYHKYAHGAKLRRRADKMVERAHRAWRDRDDRERRIAKLSKSIDRLKLSLQLGVAIKAYASFQQFEALARLATEVGRRCGGWLKTVHQNGQNGEKPRASSQRAKILSSRDASAEAHP
jgi:hypothetical protein